MLTETSPELVSALQDHVPAAVGHEVLFIETIHTGGGCHACAIDLSQDGRQIGRQAWLTRDGDTPDASWLLGFYDPANEGDDDEGICVQLFTMHPDDADEVARIVAGILRRLGVTLQGS